MTIMSQITARMYAGDADMLRLQEVTARWAQMAGSSLGYVHPGDIAHRLGNGMRKSTEPLTELVRLWQQEDEIIGWAVAFLHWEAFDVQIHPDYRGGDLHYQMVDWAEQTVQAYIQRTPSAEKAIYWDVFEGDAASEQLASDRGYRPSGKGFRYTMRSLSDPLPDVVLPEGFSIRATTGVAEVEQLIAVHSGAFGSEWTPEQYIKVMNGPGYAPEREMIVVAPDGRFAAFCIYWLDVINKTALFEPVGTHKDFQRMGLGRALMTATMQRMRDHGIETAIVWHTLDNEASTGLYAAMGFLPQFTIHEMKKSLQNETANV